MKWAFRFLCCLTLLCLTQHLALAKEKSDELLLVEHDVLKYSSGRLWWKHTVTDYVFFTMIYQGDTLLKDVLPSQLWLSMTGLNLPDTAMVDHQTTIRRFRQRRDGRPIGRMEIIHHPDMGSLIRKAEAYQRQKNGLRPKNPTSSASREKHNTGAD